MLNVIGKNIIPGIRVISDYDIKDRVFLNSGTSWETFDLDRNQSVNSLRFQGYIPKIDWRNCDNAEAQNLFNSSNSLHHSQYIRVSKIPYELMDNKQILKLYDRERFSSKLRESFTRELLSEIERYLCEQFLIKPPAVSLGLRFINNINLPTITFDQNSNLFIGLHIDCWDSSNAYQDNNVLRNRICVNLGQWPRCFLFINLSLKQIEEYLKKIDRMDDLKSVIAQNFCKFFPDYPVVKIILLPGEYYVAPTENIIHDATIPESNVEDISMTILGHFQ